MKPGHRFDDLRRDRIRKDGDREVQVILFVIFAGFANFVIGFVVAMALGYGPRNWDEVRRFLLEKR